jgi:hypothetical protein
MHAWSLCGCGTLGRPAALLMDLSMGALVEVEPDRATWTGDHRRATTRALDHLQ